MANYIIIAFGTIATIVGLSTDYNFLKWIGLGLIVGGISEIVRKKKSSGEEEDIITIQRTKPGDDIDTFVNMRKEKIEVVESIANRIGSTDIPVTLFLENTAVKVYYKDTYLGRINYEYCPNIPKYIKKRRIKLVEIDLTNYMYNKNGDEINFAVKIKTM